MTRQQLFSGRYSSRDGSAPLLRSVRYLEMMQQHAYHIGTERSEFSEPTFRVHSAIHQHRRPLDGRSADHVLRLRDLVLAVDQPVRNDRTLGILSHARSQSAAEFQNHWNDLRRGDAGRELLLFL